MKDRRWVIRILKSLGAQELYYRGHDLIMEIQSVKVTVPASKRIKDGTLTGIMRQLERAGITRQAFRAALVGE